MNDINPRREPIKGTVQVDNQNKFRESNHQEVFQIFSRIFSCKNQAFSLQKVDHQDNSQYSYPILLLYLCNRREYPLDLEIKMVED